METYLPLPEAADMLKTSVQDLQKLVQTGIIKSAMLNGALIVNQNDVLSQRKREERPDYKQFQGMQGVEISITEAAEKYKVPHPTISRWVSNGYIPILRKLGRRVMVDESYVAWCSTVYHSNPGQGKWTFKRDGTPYTKK